MTSIQTFRLNVYADKLMCSPGFSMILAFDPCTLCNGVLKLVTSSLGGAWETQEDNTSHRFGEAPPQPQQEQTSTSWALYRKYLGPVTLLARNAPDMHFMWTGAILALFLLVTSTETYWVHQAGLWCNHYFGLWFVFSMSPGINLPSKKNTQKVLSPSNEGHCLIFPV